MNLSEIVSLGQDAKAFQESDIYQRAYKAVYLNVLQAMVDSVDDETVLKLKTHLTSLEAIDRQIFNLVEDGVVAEDEIKRAESERDT